MLDADFDASSCGDDYWEDMFEPLVWHPAPERMQVSDLMLQHADRIVGMVADGCRPNEWSVAPLWDASSLDVGNLLRRAIYEHNPELYVPPQRPKRRRGKGEAFSLGETLHRLQTNPDAPAVGSGNSTQRKAGFEEYCRMYAEASGLSCVSVRAGLRENWKHQSMKTQMAWFWVSLVRREMYAGAKGKRRQLRPPPVDSVMNPCYEPVKESPFPALLDVWGMLCSWNTRAGLDSADLQRAKAEALHGKDLVDALSRSPVYLAVWHGFSYNVQQLARAWGFPSWACCMELSQHAQEYGRVHLHAFWGQSLSLPGWNSTLYQIRVQPERLRWDGNLPDMKVMRMRGNVNHAEKTCGGLYYCWVKKEGSMFRTGNVEPFKDLCRFGCGRC